jgi:hypothetical protein
MYYVDNALLKLSKNVKRSDPDCCLILNLRPKKNLRYLVFNKFMFLYEGRNQSYNFTFLKAEVSGVLLYKI